MDVDGVFLGKYWKCSFFIPLDSNNYLGCEKVKQNILINSSGINLSWYGTYVLAEWLSGLGEPVL